jgi:hypothetical protein
MSNADEKVSSVEIQEVELELLIDFQKIALNQLDESRDGVAKDFVEYTLNELEQIHARLNE